MATFSREALTVIVRVCVGGRSFQYHGTCMGELKDPRHCTCIGHHSPYVYGWVGGSEDRKRDLLKSTIIFVNVCTDL